MLHHQTTGKPSTLALVARDPARLLTVHEYWTEFDQPIDLFECPEDTLRSDRDDLIKMCESNGVPYHRSGEGDEPAFPVWIIRMVLQA
ncbi:MAG TPA: hypothetical protein VGC77_09320 [Rhodopseudomonas sp.]|uniref:hypothetical protein n=1 Tax=Rhodopseudomonas sp. TaxID=1078 RepID=UPI002ED8246C